MAKTSSYNSKRIAKNTLILYIRMIFTMLISFYTSRLVLEGLGVEDYGIYNVVGGIVAMFSFINSALATSTQRYITYELGHGNADAIQNVFITSINIHFLIAAIVVILSETAGLWFLNEKMTIPETRLNAAFWVMQCSIISSAIMIITVPFNAIIIAYEKMSTFAYISITESLLRLIIAFVITLYDGDRLILYCILILCVQALIRLIYSIYCKRNFNDITQYKIRFNIKLFREMLVFSSWNFIGSTASILMTQGLNILLNVFFCPAINAARGVAVQMQSAVAQLANNFQTALNPQIIKTYAANDLRAMHSLISRASRYSFCLLLCICLPIFLEADFALRIWLVEVPPHASAFLRLILCSTILQSVSNPLMTSAQATGHVKKYQLYVGGVLTLTLPIAYLVLNLGAAPEAVFIVEFAICLIAYFIRILIICPLVHLETGRFIKDTLPRYILIILFASAVPVTLKHFMDSCTSSSIIICLVSVICTVISSILIGFRKSERTAVFNYVKAKLAKNK